MTQSAEEGRDKVPSKNGGESMKNHVWTIVAVALLLALVASTPLAYAPTILTDTTQTVMQRQWRSLTQVLGIYTDIDDSGPFYTFMVTGNSLHETFEYSPSVTDLQGASHVYTFDKKTGDYILHSGVVYYTSPYSGLTISEVWSGWISFDGNLASSSNIIVTEGQLNQWGFAYGDTVTSFYPNAVDMGGGWWLVGFSTYTYGSTPMPDATYPGGEFWTLALNPPHVP